MVRRLESKTLMDTMLSAAPVGTAMLSDDLYFQYASPKLGEYFGLSHQAMIGHKPADIDGMNTLAIHLRLTSGQPEQFDLHVNGRDLRLNSFPIQGQGHADTNHVGLFVTDITADVQRETELRQQLRDADAYAHTVAHNLKNSITNVIGSASLIQSYFSRMSPQEVIEQSGYIIESSVKLAEIVDSLLTLASIEKQENIRLEPVDMFMAVEAATQRNAQHIAARQARLHIPEEWPTVMGFTPWVEEVWANYLSNALKYGGNPPIIQLGAEQLPDEARVRFWIRDNGQGIPPEKIDRLFQPFTRLNGQSADGHGLGLSVIKRIVHKLGGEVGVNSQPDQGSEFSFTLPMSIS